MITTSLTSYTKSIQMAMKWQKRQKEGNYAPGSAHSVDDSFQKQVDELRYPEYDRSSRMEADIDIKLTAGKKLTGEEMLYLKNHNRATYQKAKIIERDRKAYEKALASCKTKDEVEKLKADYASAAVKRLNTIRNHSGISDEQKRELFQMEHYKAAALDDAMHEFIKGSDYEALPSGNDFQEGKMEPVKDQKPDIGFHTEFPVNQPDPDDAGEEGTIMKAILDEEARWAREAEDRTPFSQMTGSVQLEGTFKSSKSQLEPAHFETKDSVDWSWVEKRMSTHVTMDNVDSLTRQVDTIVSTYVGTKNHLEQTYAEEEDKLSENIAKLDALFSQAKQRITSSYEHIVGSFYEELGNSNFKQDVKKSLSSAIDRRIEEMDKSVKESGILDRAKGSSYQLIEFSLDAKSLNDYEKGQTSGSALEKGDEAFSLKDLETAGFAAKTVSKTNSLRGGQEFGVLLAAQYIKAVEHLKHLGLNIPNSLVEHTVNNMYSIPTYA